MKQFKVVERFALRTTSIDKYYSEVSELADVITPDEEYEIAMLAKEGDQEAREKLILANLRFGISVAKAYAGAGAKLEDLINEANIGIIEAADKFDPTTGFKFISFAVWYIRKNIFAYLSNNSRTVRMPQNKVQAMAKVNAIINEMLMKNQVAPSIEQIMEIIEERDIKVGSQVISLKTVKSILNELPKSVALEGHGKGEDDISVSPINFIVNENGDIESNLKVEDFKVIKDALLQDLSEREIFIVTRKLGLDGEEPMTFNLIADRLEVHTETVRLIYNKAMRRIKIRAKSLNYTPENRKK